MMQFFPYLASSLQGFIQAAARIVAPRDYKLGNKKAYLNLIKIPWVAHQWAVMHYIGMVVS